MEHNFLKEGFVYWEEIVSPDGLIRVLNGYRDGEKSLTLVEPRILHAVTGEVLVDLWRTCQDCSVRFSPTPHTLELTIRNPYKGITRIADIDYRDRTFAFQDTPNVREPLIQPFQRASEV